MSIKRCRDCDEIIHQKRIKRGFADQCDICALEVSEPARHLGYNDGALNKATNIAIYRGTSDEVRKSIQNQRNRVH